MISKTIYKVVNIGDHLYKISSKHKTCKIAVVAAKYKNQQGPCFLAKFHNGTTEWVPYINGMEDNVQNEPGWYAVK
jgi:hypothetical protein